MYPYDPHYDFSDFIETECFRITNNNNNNNNIINVCLIMVHMIFIIGGFDILLLIFELNN